MSSKQTAAQKRIKEFEAEIKKLQAKVSAEKALVKGAYVYLKDDSEHLFVRVKGYNKSTDKLIYDVVALSATGGYQHSILNHSYNRYDLIQESEDIRVIESTQARCMIDALFTEDKDLLTPILQAEDEHKYDE